MANYWQKQAMNKRQKEKQVSNKTREDFMTAYHVMREKANDRSRENQVQGQSPVEEVQGEPDKDSRPKV